MKKQLKIFLNDFVRYPLFIFAIWVNCAVIILSMIAIMLLALIMPHRMFSFMDGYLEAITKHADGLKEG
jgi:uncharacterized membrane protein YccC